MSLKLVRKIEKEEAFLILFTKPLEPNSHTPKPDKDQQQQNSISLMRTCAKILSTKCLSMLLDSLCQLDTG